MYSQNILTPVFDNHCWYSDKWGSIDYGKKYDFSKSFFIQFSELQKKVPVQTLQGYQNQNSDFSNYSVYNKDSYLSHVIIKNEGVLYSRFLIRCFDCVDCTYVTGCNNCAHTIYAENSSNCAYGIRLEGCRDVLMSRYCTNCSDCYGCINLKNKNYCIFNAQYTKEEYEKKSLELILSPIEEQRERAITFFLSQPHRAVHVYESKDVLGDYVFNSKDCLNCFLANNIYHGKYLFETSRSIDQRREAIRDAYDCTIIVDVELFFEMIGGSKSYQCRFGVINDGSNYLEYSQFCYNSQNLFGCVGLRNKSYCILNKQYTKEEYESLVLKIIKHMNDMPYIDKKGRVYKYGEFFPPELSPFAYNETIAQEYFTLSEAEAKSKGYRWKDPEPRNYEIQIKNDQIPDHIKDVGDDIINKVIECGHAVGSPSTGSGQTAGAVCNEQCTEAFKIIKTELEFYRKMRIPLPRICPNCRHYQRIKQRNPLKLWHRTCQCAGRKSEARSMKSETPIYENTATHIHGEHPCPNEFETSYAPERPEIVYCEQCYNAEIV